MSTVFISYRREITAGEARALFNELLEKLGKNSVFMDVDSIALGRDFRSALQRTLESCDLMLVLIGRDWADVKDEAGRTRLENPGDFVRLEIEAALERDIVVTPILVQGAHMPAPEHLPADIRDLVYRNGFELSHNRWESDVAEMIRRLGLDVSKAARQVEQSASAAAAPNASAAGRATGRGRSAVLDPANQSDAAASTGNCRACCHRGWRHYRRTFHPQAVIKTTDADYRFRRCNRRCERGPEPARKIQMGSPIDEPERLPQEGPQHHVTLGAFFIGASPVTQAQWLAVVMAHPVRINRDLDPKPSFFKGIDLPVENISWNQAEEFCLRLAEITGRAYRLPSEAEWEYACRAGTMGAFHFGPTITPELANYCGTGGAVCGESDGKSIASDVYGDERYESGAYGQGPTGVSRGTTTPPGTFPPNRFGLYDMHGNVWEYCLDVWNASYADVPLDGSASLSGPPDSQSVLRGGSWSHNPAICRSAYRDSIAPGFSGWQGRIGVRVVCTV